MAHHRPTSEKILVDRAAVPGSTGGAPAFQDDLSMQLLIPRDIPTLILDSSGGSYVQSLADQLGAGPGVYSGNIYNC